MKLLNYLRKKIKRSPRSVGFSDFFLHTSDKEKEKVLKKVAKMAMKDQKNLFSRSKS